MAKKSSIACELRGVSFTVTVEGLSTRDAEAFVGDLLARSQPERAGYDGNGTVRASLDERMIIEAENLASEIRRRAERESDALRERVRSEAMVRARDEALRLLKSADREAAALTDDAVHRARQQAKTIVSRARHEAREMLDSAGSRLAVVESQAVVEAGLILRRATGSLMSQQRDASHEERAAEQIHEAEAGEPAGGNVDGGSSDALSKAARTFDGAAPTPTNGNGASARS